MTKWQQILAEREAKAREADKKLQKLIKAFQRGLWLVVAEKLLDFTYSPQSGKLLFSDTNLGRVQDVKLALRLETQKRRPGFLRSIIRDALAILGINKRYFNEMAPLSGGSVDDQVRRLVLRRLGYNIATQRIIPGGWLDIITDTTQVANRIAQDLNQSIANKITQKEFIEQFKPVFTGENGLGYLDNHFQTLSHDLYQQIDRQTQAVYADKLKLPFALYSGTAKDNTRDFCLQRIDQIYSKAFIAEWVNLDFKGKPKVGYNPFVHCGGHNCRHHLSYLSAEAVEVMGVEVNQYNKGIVLA